MVLQSLFISTKSNFSQLTCYEDQTFDQTAATAERRCVMWFAKQKNQPTLTAEQLRAEINTDTQSCVHDLSVELMGREITVRGVVDSYELLQSVAQTVLDLQIKYELRVVLDVRCHVSHLPRGVVPSCAPATDSAECADQLNRIEPDVGSSGPGSHKGE